MMHLRTEYRDYCDECLDGGENPLPFREYIWIAYHWQFEDTEGD